jgi:ankyrin repeat protein
MRGPRQTFLFARFAGAAWIGVLAASCANHALAAQPPGGTAQVPIRIDEPSVTTRAKTKPAAAAESLELSLDQAMWTAIAFEDAAQLASLLQRGADPNKPEKLSQMTPLMTVETAELVKILLESGAKPDLRDLTGRGALHHAVRMREGPEIVRMLVRAGAPVDSRVEDMSDCTPLMLAAEYYIEERDRRTITLVIRALVALGADVDAVDNGGRNALAIAAAQNQVDLIQLLLELGADPKRKLGNGRTPLDFAIDAKAQDAVRALAAAPSRSPTAN